MSDPIGDLILRTSGAAAHPAAAHHVVHFVSTLRADFTIGLLAFVAICALYEAVYKRQPHEFKILTGIGIAVALLAMPLLSPMRTSALIGAFLISIILYLAFHGVFRKQPGEIYAALAAFFAYHVLTAPYGYFLEYMPRIHINL